MDDEEGGTRNVGATVPDSRLSVLHTLGQMLDNGVSTGQQPKTDPINDCDVEDLLGMVGSIKG